MYRITRLNEVGHWFNSAVYFTREIKGTYFPNSTEAIRILKSLIKKYTVKAVGPSDQPGYICIIRNDDLIRIGFSRRPKTKLKRVNKESKQEMIWYGFTENMLTAKQQALAYFAEYRTEGDWLRISPLMAMTYFKRDK
jgi:hypothetical protein